MENIEFSVSCIENLSSETKSIPAKLRVQLVYNINNLLLQKLKDLQINTKSISSDSLIVKQSIQSNNGTIRSPYRTCLRFVAPVADRCAYFEYNTRQRLLIAVIDTET